MSATPVRIRLLITDANARTSAVFHDTLPRTMILEELEKRAAKKAAESSLTPGLAVKLPLTFSDPRSQNAPVVLRDLQDLRAAYEAALQAGSTAGTSGTITPLQRITVYASMAPEAVASCNSMTHVAEDSSIVTPVKARGVPEAAGTQQQRAPSRPPANDASSVPSHITQRLMDNILTAVRNHDFTSQAGAVRVPLAGPGTPSSKPVSPALQTPRPSIKRTSWSMSPQQQDQEEAKASHHCRRHLSSDDALPTLCSSNA